MPPIKKRNTIKLLKSQQIDFLSDMKKVVASNRTRNDIQCNKPLDENSLDFHVDMVRKIDDLIKEHDLTSDNEIAGPLADHPTFIGGEELHIEVRSPFDRKVEIIDIIHKRPRSPFERRIQKVDEFRSDLAIPANPDFKFVTTLDDNEDQISIKETDKQDDITIDLNSTMLGSVDVNEEKKATAQPALKMRSSEDRQQWMKEHPDVHATEPSHPETPEDSVFYVKSKEDKDGKASPVNGLDTLMKELEKTKKELEAKESKIKAMEKTVIKKEKEVQHKQRDKLKEKTKKEKEKEKQKKLELKRTKKLEKEKQRKLQVQAKKGAKQKQLEAKHALNEALRKKKEAKKHKHDKAQKPLHAKEKHTWGAKSTEKHTTPKKQKKKHAWFGRVKVAQASDGVEKKRRKLVFRKEKPIADGTSTVDMDTVVAEAAQSGLDEDIIKVLNILDDLLEQLPETAIDRFLQSEDFTLYEKVMSKYKIK